jgi:hypothetical protein
VEGYVLGNGSDVEAGILRLLYEECFGEVLGRKFDDNRRSAVAD